jgi:hypothetical protein
MLAHSSRGPLLAPFPDPDQAPFGFNHHDVGGLINHGLALPSSYISRIAEVMDDFDLVFP